MVIVRPKRYLCKNCGRDQYTNQICYGCEGVDFGELNEGELNAGVLKERVNQELSRVGEEDLRMIQLKYGDMAGLVARMKLYEEVLGSIGDEFSKLPEGVDYVGIARVYEMSMNSRRALEGK